MRSTSNQIPTGLSRRPKHVKKQNASSGHSQAHVVAANFTRRRSSKNKLSTKTLGQDGGLSSSSHVRAKAGTLSLQDSSKSSNKSSAASIRKYGKKQQTVPSKLCEGSLANELVRLLGSGTTSNACTTLQSKRRRQGQGAKKLRRKQKGKLEESHQVDTTRIKNRVRYLLNRMNKEQNLIDAYSIEGWKGQSREKLRPERELQKAKAQILRYQLGIRDAIQQLDTLGSQGTMKEFISDSQGRVQLDDIFCAMCKRQDTARNNDIILCDGACDRAFHQLCLTPPLKTADIPPDDEGWLCPVCDCKLECLDAVNTYFGTSYGMEEPWKNIFAEAAAFTSGDGKLPVADEDWPSEDSEDDDYIPDKQNSCRDKFAKDHEDSGDESGSLTSGESGSDIDSSDNEDPKASLLNELAGILESDSDIPSRRNNLEKLALIIDDEVALVDGKRQRKDVDYKKLHDEMFGKSLIAEDASEDEEWGPFKRLRKSKQALHVSQTDVKEHMFGDAANFGRTTSPPKHTQSRVCLSPSAVEKLRAAFKENPLPSRACKEGLSEQLGVPFGKVHVWFKNVRSAALRKGLVERARGRRRHPSELVSAKRITGSKVQKKVRSPKVKLRPKSDDWLAVMNMLNKAQLKVDRLKSLVRQALTGVHECGSLMYVPVAELKEV